VKVASFTVGATQEQAIRWKRAAEADGHRAVGTWLAVAADLYLKVRARAGNPIPLAWHRGRVRVLLDGGEAVLDGMLSPPFGTFLGTSQGPKQHGAQRFTLVHLPTARIVATLRSARQARALAAELAPVWLRDRDLSDGIINRHDREKA
jgi:hypothetical protein